MKLPENVVPMPAEQRAELKRLALAATPGPWRSVRDEENPDPLSLDEKMIVSLNPRPGDYGDLVVGLIWYDGPHAGGSKENADYIAAVSPDTTLATLSYVEALEAEVASLEGQLAVGREQTRERLQKVDEDYVAATAALDTATARATQAESRLAEAQAELAEQEREKLALVRSMAKAADRVEEGVICLVQAGHLTRWQLEEAILALRAAPTPLPSSPAAAGPGVLNQLFAGSRSLTGEEYQVLVDCMDADALAASDKHSDTCPSPSEPAETFVWRTPVQGGGQNNG